MSALAAIHVAKKQLGLDEETYRSVLVRVTGKDSTRAMSEPERQRVVEEFRKSGFTKAVKGSRTKLEGRFAKKLQALWIAGWNLGVVADRDDSALVAFVKRQTGIDHVRFVRDAEDADKAIEALKGWLAREAGVNWQVDRFLPDWTQSNGYRIAAAQWAILRRNAHPLVAESELARWMVAAGHTDFTTGGPSDQQWIAIMNTLGEQVRKVKS